RIVPMSRPRILRPTIARRALQLLHALRRAYVKRLRRHAQPAIANIARRSPAIVNPRLVIDVVERHAVGITENNVPPRFPERMAHLRRMLMELFPRLARTAVARVPIIFQIIKTPRGPLLRIVLS